MHTEETTDTPTRREDWPNPTDEQLAVIRRILAPRIRQVRAEQGVAA